jgi:sensor histidine kinase YesM
VKIRTRVTLLAGLVFSSLILISSIAVWSMNEISRLKKTTLMGFELLSQARTLHGLMKDLLFDIFTPQTYRLLKDVLYSPRFNTTLRTFKETERDFEQAFYRFIDSPRVLKMLRQQELRDAHRVAKIMSAKAFGRIAVIRGDLDWLLASGILGEESLYRQLQSAQGPSAQSVPAFLDEVRDTSYYLTNSFESYLGHFLRSLEKESEAISRRILLLFWSLTLLIGCLAVLLSLLLARRISRQIQSVEEGFRKVSMGDFTAQLELSGRDEFGVLAANINRFLLDLKRNVDSVLGLLRDVGRAISEQLDYQQVISLIVESAVADSNADTAALLMLDDAGRLVVRASAGLPVDFGEFDLQEVYREARPLFLRGGEVLPGVSSLLAVPLALPDRRLGVLCLLTRSGTNPLTDLDCTHFTTFADYAALIIDNYFKYKELLERRDAEYRALQSQIQPHFLYNLLNGLIGLNRLGERRTLERAIFSLKDMLRYTLEKDDWTTVNEELRFLAKYCELQQMRFGDRLSVRFDCQREAEAFRIPKLILQPLVENAIIHGIEPLGRPGTLEVTATLGRREGGLSIVVRDNGVGFAESGAGERHIGLANVKERLLIAFPKAFLSIRSQPGDTRVSIEIAG